MVRLFVDNKDQVTILEYLLTVYKIEYDVELDDGRWGIKPPYLTVYGVPIDEQRAYDWIKSRQEDCCCE